MRGRLFPYPFDESLDGQPDTTHRPKYSHAKSYDQGRPNDVRPVNFPDDDEGGDWSESDMAEAGMSYRKPLTR